MKIAVCDDNRYDLELMRQYCEKYSPGCRPDFFDNGADLLSAFDREQFELVFLDIEMSGLNGLEVGKTLMSRAEKPVIIFTTCSVDYAIRGYGIAIRYLTKPISFEAFSAAMSAAIEYITPKKLSICDKGTQVLLFINDILYLEMFKHQVIIHVMNRDSLKLRGTLAEFVELLPTNKFAQPHKSYFINLNYIDRLNKQKIIMTNGDIIPIGRSKSAAFHECLRGFLKGGSENERTD